jgi:hypothetical protein
MTKSVYVYVISGRGRHKVGIAADVQRRLIELKGRGAVSIVKTWYRPKDARAVEYTVREILRKHRVVGYEWFDCSAERVADAVESAIELVEAGAGVVQPSEKAKAKRAEREQFWVEWRAEYERLAAEVNQWAADNPEEYAATLAKLSAYAWQEQPQIT